MKKILSLLLSLLLSGCTTALWGPQYRHETISGMYLDRKENKLYALSAEHGYVFKVDDSFERILVLSRSLTFTPYLRDFSLSKDNALTGTVQLYINTEKVSDLQKSELISLGFKRAEMSESVLIFETRISGTNYDATGNIVFDTFKKGIHVGIALPRGGAETAQKIILTPGAVAVDATITLPAAVLLVLVMSTDSL